MRNLIDITDLSVEEIDQLIATAEDIIANPAKYSHACDGKQLAAWMRQTCLDAALKSCLRKEVLAKRNAMTEKERKRRLFVRKRGK